MDGQLGHMRQRLSEGREPDVFQSFWHHFEFVRPGLANATFVDAERFLTECGRQASVVFSTAAQAAAAMEAHGL